MRVLGPTFRKALLAVHLACSCGWIGMVVGYLALSAAASMSTDPQTVAAAWIAMELTGWFALAPLAAGSLVTGVWLALVTRWGLFRYYWVVFALAMTTVATLVLLLHLPSVARTAAVARGYPESDVSQLGSDLVHPALGLVLLLGILVLNVFKPRGLTRYGWRAQRLAKLAGD